MNIATQPMEECKRKKKYKTKKIIDNPSQTNKSKQNGQAKISTNGGAGGDADAMTKTNNISVIVSSMQHLKLNSTSPEKVQPEIQNTASRPESALNEKQFQNDRSKRNRKSSGKDNNDEYEKCNSSKEQSTDIHAVEQSEIANGSVHIKSSFNLNQNDNNGEENNNLEINQSKQPSRRKKKKEENRNRYVAMDCEMVGIGDKGEDDMLARVSIVNKAGEVLLDKYVKPIAEVTNYRTSISGIRPHDIENGENYEKIRDEVVDILQGKVLVGHGIRKDLSVLGIRHPFINTRDTARYKPLSRLVSNGRTPSLKKLTLVILGREIQNGEHNSVEDARAAMNIYNQIARDWEGSFKNQRSKH